MGLSHRSKGLFGRISQALRRWKELRTMPLRLEFVLSDYCNLNCRGCTHYSPLAPRGFEPLDMLERNMAHLSSVCGAEVKSAYLIGGEPLLYPGIAQAMRLLRKYFPSQDLYVFTNGIALPKMDNDFWEAAADCDIIIAITRYPIRFDYDAVMKICQSRKVRTEVFGDRSQPDSFFKFGLDPEKRQNPHISHYKCYNRGCVSVIGERVYPCSISACVGHLNRVFGTRFTHEKGDWTDVSEVRSAKDIFRLRDKPVPFCGYCARPEPVSYGPSQRQADEWIN